MCACVDSPVPIYNWHEHTIIIYTNIKDAGGGGETAILHIA